jgi:hypothetical protein
VLAASLQEPHASVIRAYRWDANAGWNDLGEVARLRRLSSAARMSLALDSAQAPTIAWFDLLDVGDARGPVGVKRWDGHGWRSLGSVQAKVSAVTLSATPAGTLLLGHPGGVLEWNGGTWNATTATKAPERLQSSSALLASPDGTLYGAAAISGDGVQLRMLK